LQKYFSYFGNRSAGILSEVGIQIAEYLYGEENLIISHY
jgi:hypothetical protein